MEPRFRLMVITDERADLVARVHAALQSAPPHAVAVQLRHKSLPAGDVCVLGHELRALTRAYEAALIVNDRVDIALVCDADGVQLPEHGLTPGAARALLGPHRLIGRSCHDREGLERAAAAGADYATLAPVHAVAGKGSPLGVEGFAAAIAGVDMPVYALGGVRADDVPALRDAGARGIAVIREVMQAPDPGARLRALLASW